MSLFRKRKVELPDDLVVKTDFTNNDNDQQMVQESGYVFGTDSNGREPYVA